MAKAIKTIKMNKTTKVKVIKKAMFRDGGTTIYKDEKGKEYFKDGRIMSNTRDKIYSKYPGEKGARQLDVELEVVFNF